MTGNKYTELQTLHEQLRTSERQSQRNRNLGVTNKRSDHFSTKSSAQVESLVRPQVVSPNSGELKLGRERPYRLMGRFSASERETVLRRAKNVEMSVNEYIRTVTLGPGYTPPLPPTLQQTLRDLNFELTKLGTNINQLTKDKNGGKATSTQVTARLDAIRRPLIGALRAVKDALGQGRPMP